MHKKEIQAKANKLLAAGVPKAEVFAQLSGRGVTDRRLAYWIAAYVGPERRRKHRLKVDLLIAYLVIQTVLVFIFGLGSSAGFSPQLKSAVLVICVLLSALFLLVAWGLYQYRAGAYTAYLLLIMPPLPKSFNSLLTDHVSLLISLATSIAILAYVWYVRSVLFPDLAFFSAKKFDGKYVFSD